MTNGLARIAERLQQQAYRRRQQLQDRLAAAPAAGVRSATPFAPGDRVFDTVTGQEGEVIARTLENIIVPVTER